MKDWKEEIPYKLQRDKKEYSSKHNAIQRVWIKYQQLGTNANFSSSENRCIKALNGLVLIVIGLLWIQLPLVIELLPTTQYILASFLIWPVLSILVPYLNYKGYYLSSRLFYSFSTLFLIIFDAVQLGITTENHIFTILVFVSCFIIYPSRQRAWLWLVVLVSISSFVVLEWYFYLYGGLLSFPSNFIQISRWSSLSAFVTLILGIMAYHYNVFTKVEKDLEHEQQLSENLLLNVLPHDIAEELKENGVTEPKKLDDVTILFTDFKNFTKISGEVTAGVLVKKLHYYFSVFDQICEKHGIEKIKTIGDAYMAAGGIPNPLKNSSINVIEAALEILQFVAMENRNNAIDNGPNFEIRIGVHTGSVVAGVVGLRKFQFDIWGDAVNTASRMESNGAPGEINISHATYIQIKDKFPCKSRGEIEVKGKGKMQMYFVDVKE